MPDKDKVIKGLTVHCDYFAECDECPYRNEGSPGVGCVDELCNDAIDLLKEQEPVKPIRINTNFEQSWKCGECGGLVNTHFKYCPYCGREVKWE